MNENENFEEYKKKLQQKFELMRQKDEEYIINNQPFETPIVPNVGKIYENYLKRTEKSKNQQ